MGGSNWFYSKEWLPNLATLVTIVYPNFFGNPAHHGYFDLFTWRWEPALTFPDGQYIDWGIKNYVEGGAYMGLLPLLLALLALLHWGKARLNRAGKDNSASGIGYETAAGDEEVIQSRASRSGDGITETAIAIESAVEAEFVVARGFSPPVW